MFFSWLTHLIINSFVGCLLAFLKQSFSMMWPWLSWNSLCRPGWPRTQKSACLCLPSAGITGEHHHAGPWLWVIFWGRGMTVSECVRQRGWRWVILWGRGMTVSEFLRQGDDPEWLCFCFWFSVFRVYLGH